MPSSKLPAGGIKTFSWNTVPKDWQFELLGNVCAVRRGASPRPAGDPRYFGGDIPWFKIGDATRSGSRFLSTTEEFVNEKGAECSVRVPVGSLIVANSGVSLGFAVIAAVEGCIHDGWLLLDDFTAADRDFLYYCINYLTPRIRIMADGTTQPNLNTEIGRKLILPLPPISEQRAIAAVLGALDDKIELNRRMNETLEALAQSLFKSWFVPAYRSLGAGRDATQSALPKGWEVRGLDEIANFLNGLALQKFPPNGDDSLPVIKIAQLRAGNTEGADRAGTNLPSQYIIENGDVLFSWSGSLLVDIWCGGRGALNQHLFKVTSDKFPKWFYYLWTRHHLAAFQNTAADKATTMGHIQRHHLSEAKVFVPTAAELEKMGKQMSPLIEKLIANNLESRTLAALRDALLPKLLSGELRLPSQCFGKAGVPAATKLMEAKT